MNSSNMADLFIRSYLDTALKSCCGDDNEELYMSLKLEDFSEKALQSAMHDCNDFRQKAGTAFDTLDQVLAGSFFWLTRNNHGHGFRDAAVSENDKNRLTEIAHSYGAIQAVVGDDGKLYFE